MNVIKRAALVALGVVMLSLIMPVGAASAKGGQTGGSGNDFFLNDTFSATANHHYGFGRADDQVYVGDWDGNRTDTLGVRRGGTFYLNNSVTGAGASQVVVYGRSSDVVLVGDWNGDGKDTLAVRRGNTYYFSNSLTSSTASSVVVYGRASDVVLVGDWNGDGKDTLAVRRGNTYYFSNTLTGGRASSVVVYGKASDKVLVGDWNGDGKDTLAVRRGSTYYIKNVIGGGGADRTLTYGRATDTTLVGDWNGDRTATLGVRRPAVVAPLVYRGSGDDVISVNTRNVPSLVTITCPRCQDNFIVEGNGGYEDGLLVNAIGSYSGRQLVDMTGDRTTQLTIQADAPWSVTIEPASDLKTYPRTSGHGDDAIYLASGGNFQLRHDGDSNFIVQSYAPGADYGDLIVNEIGSYSGVRPISAPAYVEIMADGNWSITRR